MPVAGAIRVPVGSQGRALLLLQLLFQRSILVVRIGRSFRFGLEIATLPFFPLISREQRTYISGARTALYETLALVTGCHQ